MLFRSIPMIDINDIISLPKGQAFVLVNGGELYKLRIPMSLLDEQLANYDIKQIINEINQIFLTSKMPPKQHKQV